MPRQQSSVTMCLRVRVRVCLCACTHITAWEIPTSGSHVTELFPAGPAGRAWRTAEGQECVSSLGSTELTLWHQSSGSSANAGLLPQERPGKRMVPRGARPGSLHNCGKMGAPPVFTCNMKGLLFPLSCQSWSIINHWGDPLAGGSFPNGDLLGRYSMSTSRCWAPG